jgi:hypothetical protein
MRTFLTLIFATALTCIYSFSFAQKQKRAPYNAIINTLTDGKFFGKITAINDTEILLSDKRDVQKGIKYSDIKKIRIFKYRNDIGYTAVTGALALGTIAAAQSFEDQSTSLIVGIGGTLAVVTLSALLHNVFHGAEIKMDATKDIIEFPSVSKKLGKYVVTDPSLKP